MPRGNDKEAAAHELADRFGQGLGNAEELIDANLLKSTQALRAAEILPRLPDETKEARKDLSKFTGPDGEKAVSVAVRGSVEGDARYTVCVFEDDDGRQFIGVVDDKGKFTRGDEPERKQEQPKDGKAHAPSKGAPSVTRD